MLLLAFGRGNVVATGVIVVITIVNIIVYKLRQLQEAYVCEESKSSSTSQEDQCRCFSLAEIRSATSNFDNALVIGKGGFGRVYKGLMDNGANTVAIKRLNSKSKQGAREFWTEIEMLSKFRHTHLVSLVGYCIEDQEMILVYEHMPHGTLADHLYKTASRIGNSPLPWLQRLKISIGAARGLEYLHTGTGVHHRVIHRDVKSSNILLDENWAAKISDFGLSKIGPANQSCTHVSTNVKGTFGYLDPEYYLTRRLTRKSDVYAFGVVLFEVLCGRPAVDITVLNEEQISLALWAKYCIKEGKVDGMMDPSLRGQVSPNCLQVFTEIAGKCLRSNPNRRPIMADAVARLEFALALQEGREFSIEDSFFTVDADDTVDREETMDSSMIQEDVIDVVGNGGHQVGRIIPDFDALCSDETGSYAETQCHYVMRRLGDFTKATFLEFENAVASNISTTPLAGGGIHHLTRYVMNYIEALSAYSDTLNVLLKDHETEAPNSLLHDMSADNEKDSIGGSSSSCVSPIAAHLISLTSILERNLDDKSRLYNDSSLGHLFLMNNMHYMSQTVKASKLRTVFGDEWVRKCNWKFQQAAVCYERATWSSIVSLLRDEGLQNPRSNSVSRTLIKERLRGFYLAFEDVYKSQTGWSVPDTQLRDDLRISTSLKVIQAYRTFVGRHTNHVSDRHIKYNADDLENYIMDLFEGSPRSLHSFHRR